MAARYSARLGIGSLVRIHTECRPSIVPLATTDDRVEPARSTHARWLTIPSTEFASGRVSGLMSNNPERPVPGFLVVLPLGGHSSVSL